MNKTIENEDVMKVFDLLFKAEKDYLQYKENEFKPSKVEVLEAIEDEYKTKVPDGIVKNAIEVALQKGENKKQREADIVDDLSKETLKNKALKEEMKRYQKLIQENKERKADIKNLLKDFLSNNNINIDKDTLKAIEKIAKKKSIEDIKGKNKDDAMLFLYKEIEKIVSNNS